MPPKGNERKENNGAYEWLVKKLFWFLFVPTMTILSYYTQIRPYIIVNHGTYVAGWVDGSLFTFSIVVFVIWLLSKLD
jgi:hypothetical protein